MVGGGYDWLQGNGTYLAKFANLSALAGSIAIAGHWKLIMKRPKNL